MGDEARQRKTLRKRLIEDALQVRFAGKPVLLEELRWDVLKRERAGRRKPLVDITDAMQKSFARTIREHASFARIYRIPNPATLFVGVLARAAVFRIRSKLALDSFLNSDSPSVCLRVAEGVHPRIHIKCFLYIGADYVASHYIPVTSQLAVVSNREPTSEDLAEIAQVKFPLYKALRPGGIEFDSLERIWDRATDGL